MTFRNNPFLNSRTPIPDTKEEKRILKEQQFDNTLNYIHKHGYAKQEKRWDKITIPHDAWLVNLKNGKYSQKYITKNGKRIRIN